MSPAMDIDSLRDYEGKGPAPARLDLVMARWLPGPLRGPCISEHFWPRPLFNTHMRPFYSSWSPPEPSAYRLFVSSTGTIHLYDSLGRLRSAAGRWNTPIRADARLKSDSRLPLLLEVISGAENDDDYHPGSWRLLATDVIYAGRSVVDLPYSERRLLRAELVAELTDPRESERDHWLIDPSDLARRSVGDSNITYGRFCVSPDASYSTEHPGWRQVPTMPDDPDHSFWARDPVSIVARGGEEQQEDDSAAG